MHPSLKLPASEAYKLHSLRFAGGPRPQSQPPRPTASYRQPIPAGRRINGPATA